jgi:YgiT-type zinc finger domain-containing protein
MTKHTKLKCPICGGTQKPAETTFSVDLGFGVVVIRQVPASVCEICGEELIHDEVAASLEQIVDQARERQRTVEVVRYDRETQYSLAS